VAKASVKSLERKLVVRKLAAKDFEQVERLQNICFPSMAPWTREQFESQLRIFPEGQICIEYQGRVVASSASLIVDFDLYSDWHAWLTMSGDGFIRNHAPTGDTLYGIEIMVEPEFRGMRLARRLYDARKQVCRERNLMRMVIGGRIPGYAAHRAELSAREYVDRVMDRSLHDPVLTTQLSNGLVLQRLIPDYLPSDEDSAGFATHLEWTNLDYIEDRKRGLRPVQPVRVCAVNYELRPVASFDVFAKQAEFFVDVASEYHADFVVFPELFTLQLLSFMPAARPAEAARMLAEFSPQYLELFTKLAIQHNVNIVGGSQFFLEDGKLYNVACLFQRNGAVGKQYKIHITPAEKRWWGIEGGSKVEVFETDRGRVAIAVCYDVEFPELVRVAVKKGAQILFVPFNTDERHAYLRVRYCSLARCVENHIYVAISGCIGNLPFVDNADVHYAESAIFTPADIPFSRDCVAAECTPNVETVVMHDVDLELLRRHRYLGTTQNWNDRRRDLFQLRYLEGEELKEV
jgi:predicted amidohydrolase/ribosomal protein S18 acetylase RimI-like enzyme